MKVEITSYKNLGDKDKERIILTVKENVELGNYIIATTTVNNDDTISASITNVYWLPNQKVKAGDLVVIYTKTGAKKKIENEDGSTSYFFYWSLSDSLLSLQNSTVVLFETTWTNKEVKKSIVKADEYIEQ